jgi:hypothetical protein
MTYKDMTNQLRCAIADIDCIEAIVEAGNDNSFGVK